MRQVYFCVLRVASDSPDDPAGSDAAPANAANPATAYKRRYLFTVPLSLSLGGRRNDGLGTAEFVGKKNDRSYDGRVLCAAE